jgi:hypothetical protein
MTYQLTEVLSSANPASEAVLFPGGYGNWSVTAEGSGNFDGASALLEYSHDNAASWIPIESTFAIAAGGDLGHNFFLPSPCHVRINLTGAGASTSVTARIR